MKQRQPDYILFFIVILLMGIGLSLIYSASAEIGLKKFGNEQFFLKRQIIGSILAIAILIFFSYVNAGFLQKISTPMLVIAFLMCIFVFIPGLSVKMNSGSKVHRWLNLHFFIFQPSEFVKIAIVINLAAILHKKKEKIKNFLTGFAYPLSIVILFFFLILIQPDFTTAVFIVVVGIVMFYIAGVSVKHLSMLALVGLPVIFMLIGVAGYRLKRLWGFITSESDVMGAGFQITESLKGFMRGGLTGTGIGKGRKTMPEPFTDFIFSVYGEEIGFLGALAVIVLFAFLAYRGIRIAFKTDDTFFSLLAFGLTFVLISQALINIMVTIGILPTTGIALPFLSYGRSSLITSAFIAGVLLNISRKIAPAEAEENI